MKEMRQGSPFEPWRLVITPTAEQRRESARAWAQHGRDIEAADDFAAAIAEDKRT